MATVNPRHRSTCFETRAERNSSVPGQRGGVFQLRVRDARAGQSLTRHSHLDHKMQVNLGVFSTPKDSQRSRIV